MAEYIDRDDALSEIELREALIMGDGRVSIDAMKSFIKNRPAADVAPVVHGRWIKYPRAHYFKCSECKYTVPYKKAMLINKTRQYNYCPHCGAKMNGGDNDATD